MDKEELTDWIYDSLRQLDEEEVPYQIPSNCNEVFGAQARGKFPQLDADKDGFVDFDEYVKDSFVDEELDDPEIKVSLKLKLRDVPRMAMTCSDLWTKTGATSKPRTGMGTES